MVCHHVPGKDLKDAQELTKRLEGVAEYMAGMEKRIKEILYIQIMGCKSQCMHQMEKT